MDLWVVKDTSRRFQDAGRFGPFSHPKEDVEHQPPHRGRGVDESAEQPIRTAKQP